MTNKKVTTRQAVIDLEIEIAALRNWVIFLAENNQLKETTPNDQKRFYANAKSDIEEKYRHITLEG